MTDKKEWFIGTGESDVFVYLKKLSDARVQIRCTELPKQAIVNLSVATAKELQACLASAIALAESDLDAKQ